jgi:adenylate kinase family enzyme
MERGSREDRGRTSADERLASKLFILALLANIPLGILINLASSDLPAWMTPIAHHPWFALIPYSAIVLYIGLRSRKVSLGPVGALPGFDRADRHRIRVRVSKYADDILASEATRQVVIHVRLQSAEDMIDSVPSTFKQLVEGGITADQILDVFDSADRALLIVGQPGAGKSRLLACLAKALIARAAKSTNEPLPVIVNLSSWRPGQRFESWVISQIKGRYSIRRGVAPRMIEQQMISVLLDGLDENPDKISCLKAISRFRLKYRLDMAICCRESEYRVLAQLNVRAPVSGAIRVPLPQNDEIKEYLDASGVSAETSSVVLQSRRNDLIRSPLMLKIISRLSISAEDQAGLVAVAPEVRQEALFDAYINELLAHPRDPHTRSQERPLFDRDNTMRWLVSLASAMHSKGTTEIFSSSPWLPREVEARIDAKEWPLGVTYTAVVVGVLSYFFLRDLRALLYSEFIGPWIPSTWIAVGVSLAVLRHYVKESLFFNWGLRRLLARYLECFILGFLVVSLAALLAANAIAPVVVGGIAGILLGAFAEFVDPLFEDGVHLGWALAFTSAVIWTVLPKYHDWHMTWKAYIHELNVIADSGHGNGRISHATPFMDSHVSTSMVAIEIGLLVISALCLIGFFILLSDLAGIVPDLILSGAKRAVMAANGYGPWMYERFVNYLRERGILIKSGSSLQFGHPLLLDYLASQGSRPRRT